MKHTSLIAASAIAATALAGQAAAELKYDNASGGFVRLYGQFSPAYQSVDDGVDRKSTLVDNAHSNTRVGLWVEQPYGGNIFSFNFETGLGLRPSDGVSQDFTPQGVSWDRTDLRKIDFALRTESYGKFYAGQGSMATDGVAENDFGSNGMTTYNGIGDTAGSFQFRDSTGALSGVEIGSVTPSFDGGRRGRVRYDSPSFSGFTIAAAAGTDILTPDNDDDYYDVALKYANEFGGTKVLGGIGFSRRTRDDIDRDDTFGSVAVKFQSGFNFAVAAGSRKDDGDYAYGKVGYETQWWSIGDTSFALDYYKGSDFNIDGSKSTAYGFGVNQNIDSIKTQVYLGLRRYTYEDSLASYQDIDSVLFGARWKF